ncbi:inosine-uridine nucleoside N-ribohydrolase [Gluconacetobacter johannae DSM 13595]|nr:inosine-uridine nucleoside N-ribohydrolase [Gluconacetobacter johannae DSM 13595]
MPLPRRSLLALAAGGGLAAGIRPPRPAHSMPAPRRVIIDTDTATDDALALLLALNAPSLTIEAITIVVGNVEFDQEVRNALYTLQVAGAGGRFPVHPGTARPLLRETHRTATWIHGHDGMSDSNFPPPVQKPETEGGVDAMIRLVRRYPGEITIIALGALTNVAMAFLRDPELPRLVRDVVFMGGFHDFHGNVTPAATYNLWVDPEAARIVLRSGARLTSVGFDASVRASVLDDGDFARIAAMETDLSRFFLRISRMRRAFCKQHQKMAGPNEPDGLTVAVAVDPTIGTLMLPRAADIETQGDLTRGMMVVDELDTSGRPPNVTMCADADTARFKALVFDALRGGVVQARGPTGRS